MHDYGNGIAVDSSGNAYVTGNTTSTDFPTVNPFQLNLGGGDYANASASNAFVTEVECRRLGPGLLHLPGRQWC